LMAYVGGCYIHVVQGPFIMSFSDSPKPWHISADYLAETPAQVVVQRTVKFAPPSLDRCLSSLFQFSAIQDEISPVF
jgi:hypothetical protein